MRVEISIEGDEYIATLVEGRSTTLICIGHLNPVNHDCEIDRGEFPSIPDNTEVRVIPTNPHSWSGRLLFYGAQKPFCPRCDIDPKDCGEHP